MIRIGTCGWGFLRPKRLGITGTSTLNAYSKLFDVVEVNYTFYRIPREDTVKRWRKEVPEDFVFTVKAYKGITHEKLFENCDEDVEAILKIAKILKAPIILFQTPKSFKQTPENERKVLNFLETLPNKIQYALELRSWNWDERFSKWIWVVDPFAQEPPEQEVYYFRLHGSPPGERMYHYRYTDDDLKHLTEVVRKLEGDRWVFFNNVWMYEDALRFKQLLKTQETLRDTHGENT